MFYHREFNFSGEYGFRYDYERNNLICERNIDYPLNFYKSKNVELISYIIGDNGSGKTTLLDLLMRVIPGESGTGYGEMKFIYGLKDDTEDKVHVYTTIDKIEITDKGGVNIEKCRSRDVMKSTSVVFYSDIFDRDRYNRQYDLCGVVDLSFNGLLKRDSGYKTANLRWRGKSELREFLDADMIREIDFISGSSQGQPERWIPFPLPKRLNIVFAEDEKVLSSVYRYDSDDDDLNEAETEEQNHNSLDFLRKKLARACREILGQYDNCFKRKENSFRYKINRGILMSAMEYVFPNVVGNGTLKEFALWRNGIPI